MPQQTDSIDAAFKQLEVLLTEVEKCGDTLFTESDNRMGVIATGVATPARWIDHPPEFEGDKAHILKLREFRKLKEPLSVQDVFRVAGKTYRVSSVYELHGEAGKRVWEAATRKL